MPPDEKSNKHHDESDSEEEEEVEVIPKLDIDVTKLTPLSPEVISKQVSPGIPFRFSFPFLGIPSGYNQPWYAQSRFSRHYDVLIDLSAFRAYRNNRTCRTREIDGGESNIGCHDRPF